MTLGYKVYYSGEKGLTRPLRVYLNYEGLDMSLLKVKDLVTQFKTEAGLVRAVDGVSYHIEEQEIVGLVGESGCGKSVSQLSVMQLVSAPGKIAGGEVIF